MRFRFVLIVSGCVAAACGKTDGALVEPGGTLPAQSDAGTATDAAGATTSAPAEAPLAAEDIGRSWVKLPVPHGSRTTAVVRGGDGAYVALAAEQPSTGGKAIGEVYNFLYRSLDGISWERLTGLPPKELIYGKVDLAYGAGRWLMLESRGGDAFVWTSTDLQTWTKASLPADRDGGDVAPFDVGRIVRLGDHFFGLGTNAMFESPDGLAWTRSFLSIVQAHAIAAGNGMFVIAGALSARSSTDGRTWVEHTPACSADVVCVGPPGGAAQYPEIHNVVFEGGKFWLDKLASADGASWQPHGELPPSYALGGHLFNDTGADGVLANGEVVPLQAWKPGSAPQTIAVDASLTSPSVGDVGPSPIATPLPGGETCLTNRCVQLGSSLYLLR